MKSKKNGNGGSLPGIQKKDDLKKEEKSSLSDNVVEFILTLDISQFENINVSSIARKFDVNRCYLSQKFKHDKKLSLSDYILMVKILRATTLLAARNDITIEDLARLMGYSNSDYFSRVFKEKIGTTPGKYKSYIKKIGIIKA